MGLVERARRARARTRRGIEASGTSRDARYIDATAALWYCNVGYGREEIGEAVAAADAKTPEPTPRTPISPRRPDRRPRPSVSRRCRRSTSARVFFTSGRRRVDRVGGQARAPLLQPDRRARADDSHLAASAPTTASPRSARVWPGDRCTARASSPRPRRRPGAVGLRRGAARRDQPVGAERVAAFFCEPVIGAGGVLVPPAGYLPEVRAICRDAGCLLVADEVITGFGRLGDWFASERFGLDPDLIMFAKGSTSGYLPLGGVIASAGSPSPSGAGRRRRLPARVHVLGSCPAVRGVASQPRHPRARGTNAARARARGGAGPRRSSHSQPTRSSPRFAREPACWPPSSWTTPRSPIAAVRLLAREHGVITRVAPRRRASGLAATRDHAGELDELATGLAAALDRARRQPGPRLTQAQRPLSGGQLPANEAWL